jgi:serine/threonine protein phosphatase PrpC
VDFAIQVVAAHRVGDDRAYACLWQGGHLLVVADGAGGTSGGAEAADTVVATAPSLPLASPHDCTGSLKRLDHQLTAIGETTAVVVLLSDGHVWGASVGDSGAWLITESSVLDLTQDQGRKPLLGTGAAMPVGFGAVPFAGRLLLGSDGLFKYVRHDHICDLVRSLAPMEAAAALIEAARLPSGGLQDDIAVIVAG